MTRPIEYVGELVRVQDSDHADMPDSLVVWISPPDGSNDIATLTFEISRTEARELIAAHLFGRIVSTAPTVGCFQCSFVGPLPSSFVREEFIAGTEPPTPVVDLYTRAKARAEIWNHYEAAALRVSS